MHIIEGNFPEAQHLSTLKFAYPSTPTFELSGVRHLVTNAIRINEVTFEFLDQNESSHLELDLISEFATVAASKEKKVVIKHSEMIEPDLYLREKFDLRKTTIHPFRSAGTFYLNLISSNYTDLFTDVQRRFGNSFKINEIE